MNGYSLHIGLNRIDPGHYGSNGLLRGCENDARDMKSIADSMGFRSTILLNEQATTANVLGQILKAAEVARSGEIFFISYSGHGGQVPDTNGDEDDSMDETWCLYDRQLVDDQIAAYYARFAPGVRIVVLSDSCHSGTVTKMLLFEKTLAAASDGAANGHDDVRIRTLPRGIMEETYRHSKDDYDRVQAENPEENRSLISASVLLISGCQDWQLSADYPSNGLFTQTLKEVWNGGTFGGNYLDFHRAIYDRMPSYQKPNYFRQGMPNPAFDGQPPFQI